MYKAKLVDKPLEDKATIVQRLNAVPMDWIRGCLIDNELWHTGKGYIAFIECYVNSNQSAYEVWVSESDEDDEALIGIFTQLYADLYEEYIGA